MRAVWAFSVGWVLVASGASAVEGIYHGKGSDPGGYRWRLYAKITALSDGRYRNDVQSTNATCASQTDGIGTLRGKTLKVAGSCPLTIRFKGRSARIVEGAECASEHGATCTYSGTLQREE
jgi:hypothetical protein